MWYWRKKKQETRRFFFPFPYNFQNTVLGSSEPIKKNECKMKNIFFCIFAHPSQIFMQQVNRLIHFLWLYHYNIYLYVCVCLCIFFTYVVLLQRISHPSRHLYIVFSMRILIGLFHNLNRVNGIKSNITFHFINMFHLLH